MGDNNNIKEKYDTAWTSLAIIMVLVCVGLFGMRNSNTNRPVESSNIQYDGSESAEESEFQISVESSSVQYDDIESTEEILEINDDVTKEEINASEESQSLLIDLPIVENKTNIFEENLDINKIFVFDTNIGDIISITDGDDKVADRVTYNIDCQSGDEIMPFNIFFDFFDTRYYEDFMHDACAFPLVNNDGIVYQTNDFKNAYYLRGLEMMPFREFLEYNGLENEIKDTYTFDEVAALYYKFNRPLEPIKRTLEQ